MRQRYLFSSVFLFLIYSSLFAQTQQGGNIASSSADAVASTDWLRLMDDHQANFFDIQRAFNRSFETKEREMLRVRQQGTGDAKEEENEIPGGYMQFRRWENFWKPRVFPSGQFPNLSIANDEFTRWQAAHSASGNHSRGFGINAVSNWTPLGPSVLPIDGGAGRLCCIRFDPTNSNIIYIGAAAGGLWKSTNGGSTWSSNTDNLQVLGVSDIVIDPANTNIMYLATGDGDAGDTYSVGILKSTDGGATWNPTGLNWSVNQGILIRKVIMHPSNDSIVLAATNNGVYKTTNAGSTWSQVLSGSTRDIAFNTADPTIVYVGGYGANPFFFKSTNTGGSFTQITSGLPSSGVQRIAVGVTANDASYVYLLIARTSDQGLLGVYRSVDGGNTFTQQTGSSPNLLGWNTNGGDAGGQGWYDLSIAVNPTNKNDIYTGGVNQWRSTNGGTSWTNISYWAASGTNYVHADIHSLGFLPGSSTTLLSGNDGGIFKSTDNGTTWADLSSGLSIAEMYRLSTSATNPTLNLAGNQDNGTTRDSIGLWEEVVGGDGMECIIDYANASVMYGEIYYGEIYKTTTGSGGFSGTPIVSSGGTAGTVNENGDWVTPYIINPVTHTTLLVGKSQVYQSTNSGSAWTTLGNISGGSGSIIALAYGISNTSYIYAAKVNALFMSSNGGSTWSTITGTLPVGSASITYIAVDQANPQRVWVTFSGYSAGNKVFFSANAGSSWTNVSGTLPNLPVNCIVFQNGTSDGLYIGTDVGVYYKDASLSDWAGFMTGLPNVIVDELEIQYSSGKLRAATYGRGMWESPLNAVPSNTITVGSISPFSYCAGASISVPYTATGTFNAGNVFTAQLSNSAGVFSSTVNIGSITSTASGTISAVIPGGTAAGAGYRVRVISSNPSFLGSTNASNITVSAVPIATASSNTPVCATNSVNLSSSGGSSYAWNGPNSFSSTAQNPSIANSTIAATGTYTVTVTSSGCSSTATTAVVVNAKPTPVASNNTPLCAGSTVNFSSSGGTSYAWSGPNSFSSTLQNPSISNATTAATGTYAVTVTNSAGCTATATTTTTVNAKPSPTASNNTPICAGSNVNLSSSGGSSYGWSGPNSFSSTLQNPSIIAATTAATGTYTVTVTGSNGCTATATTVATVNAKPTPTASSNTPVCAGNSLNLSSSGGTSYSWTGPNAFASTNQNPIVLSVTAVASGTYSVTVTNASGCTATASATVTINAAPTPTASNNSPACSGNNITLSSSGGSSYAWTGPNSFSASVQNPVIIGATVAATGTYTVTVTNSSGCTARVTTTVTVNASPTASAVSNSPVCSNNNINLSASGGTIYIWNGPNSFSSTATNPTITNAATAATGTYTVIVTNANGCSATAITAVTVNASPTAVAGSNSPVCAGTTINLNSSGGISYQWNGPNGYSSSIQNPSITGAGAANSGSYSVLVTDANSCTGSASTTVTVTSCVASTELNLILFLEGYYIGSGTMKATLFNLGLSGDATTTDSIQVNLWLPAHLANSTPDYSVKTILHTNGTATASYPSFVAGSSYYIAVRHRNSIETWSSNPVLLSSVTSYNFSTAVTQAYSNGFNQPMKNMGGGVFAFYGGNANGDATVDASDMEAVDNDTQIFLFGYVQSDCSGNGAVDASDMSLIDNNSQLFLFFARP